MATRTVYSSILFRQQGVDGSDHFVPVSEGERWIIRDIDCYCNVPVITESQFLLTERPTDAAIVFFAWGLGEQSAKQWQGRQVFDYLDGEGGFDVYGADDAPVDVSISGYRLILP